MRYLLFGAGAIGSSFAVWMKQAGLDVALYVRPEKAAALRQGGLHCKSIDGSEIVEQVEICDDLSSQSPDVLLLAVKNYSLAAVSELCAEAFGDKPLVIGLQNGAENQIILPRLFSKVAYGVLHYNAWLEAPNIVGVQKRGPLLLGTQDPELRGDVRRITQELNRALPTSYTERINDAVYTKLMLNLSNSIGALLGLGVNEVDDIDALQKVLSQTLAEGIRILKAASYREFKVPSSPSWMLIQAGAYLPRVLTKAQFRKNLAKTNIGSMTQDLLLKQQSDHELESLNGAMLTLAQQYTVRAPFNKALYEICQQRFAASPFVPMKASELLREIKARC